jgi:CheY-like chemotaxis protein
MSHEVRTPLNGILGYTELLLNDRELNANQRQYLERIQGGGAALLTIVNDVLDFSKIEAGQVELQPELFALPALTESAVSLVRSLVDQKRLSLDVTIDDRLPISVVGDPDRLRQVLLNLLNNAVKFTPAGSITLDVRCEDDNGARAVVCFSVEDTGLGIPEDKIGRLFQRFSQVDGSVRREFGGTGLGLAISRHLVELMGGRIGVDSKLGKGSRFWFMLPLGKAPEVSRAEVLCAAEQPRSTRSARILLVDDNEVNQEIARAVLEAAGHAVTVVSDGTDSVLAVQARPYDVVLMDIQMPVMDGITATQYIRALEGPARNVAIIAMTANVLPQQVKAFKEAGMDDHVGKPFKRDQLLAAIDRCLGSDAIVEDGDVAPKAVLDRSVYSEVLHAVGADIMSRLLDQLAELLESCLSDDQLSSTDRARLARDAHVMMSSAGALGFMSLSEVCSYVERACETGTGLRQGLEHLRAARQQTLDEIVALRTAA